MAEFIRAFCSEKTCRTYTIHVRKNSWEASKCVHRHEEDEIKAWDKTREAFRLWLADLAYTELLEVADDIAARLIAEDIRIKAQKERTA